MLKRFFAACLILLVCLGPSALAQAGVDLVAAEYFAGADPGEGKGIPLALADPGIAGWRTVAALDAAIAASGTVQKYSVRFKSSAGVWSNPLVRSVLMYPANATLHPTGPVLVERSLELQSTTRTVAGIETTALVSGSAAGATEDFRALNQLNGLSASEPGVQLYKVRARAVSGDWGNAIQGAALIQGIPANLQSTHAEAARAEVRFGVDTTTLATLGRIAVTLGGQTLSQTAANGESKTTTLSKLARQIQENASLASVYAVSASGETLTVRLFSPREFAGGEVSAGTALVESGRTPYPDASLGAFELSQPDGLGGVLVKSVSPATSFGSASFLPETGWTVANFAANIPISVVATTLGGVGSNALTRQVLGYANNFALQGAQAARNPPSVSLAVDEPALSSGARPGLLLGGTLVDVAWGGAGTTSELILTGLVARIRSDPALSAKYTAEVVGGSLVLRTLSERALETGEIGGYRALKQVGASAPVPRGITELEYATRDPNTAGTVFTKIPVQISNAGFLSAGALDVTFTAAGGLAPIFARAVSSDGTRSAFLTRTAVLTGNEIQIHPAVAVANGHAVTLSVNTEALTDSTRPGFVLGGTLVDAAWSDAGGSIEKLLGSFVSQIRLNATLSSKYSAAVLNGKLALRTIAVGSWDSSEVSSLRAMRVDTMAASSELALSDLEYTTGDPTAAGTAFTKIPALTSISGFLTASSLDVNLVPSGGLGSVCVRAIAKDGTRSASLVRNAIVTGGGLQIHPAAAATNGPSATLVIDEPALSDAVRPGFKLGGTLVDVAWGGAGTSITSILTALTARIRSDATLSSNYSATVVNGSLVVSSLKSAAWSTGEISDLRAMRSTQSFANSRTAVVDLEVAVGTDGTPATNFVKVPVTLSGDAFLTAGTVDVQISTGAGVKTVGVRASSSEGVKSALLSRNIVVSSASFDLQSTTAGVGGSAALFGLDPSLKTGETVDVKLGSEHVRILKTAGMTSADVLARLIGAVRESATLAQNYAVRVQGGSLLVETVAARAWDAGELEATFKATLQITKTRVNEWELETFAGVDPGLGLAKRLTGLGEQLGCFASKSTLDVAVQSTAGVQGYGVRARNKGGEWSNTLSRNVLVFGAGFQMQPTRDLSGAGIVELIPGPDFGKSGVRVEIMGTAMDFAARDGESSVAFLTRIADAVNGSRWIQGTWRAQVSGGRLMLRTVSSRTVADGEIKGDSNLVASVLERGRAEDAQRGIAKIQIAEIAKDIIPTREVLPTGMSPLMTVGEYGLGSLQLPPGVRRFAVRAIGAGGEQGNWTIAKVAILRFTSSADNAPPVLTLQGGTSMLVEVGTAFVEPGWQATDSVSGNLNSAVTVEGTVDTTRPGIYTLRYQVLDDAGNVASASRTVTVKDSVAPVWDGLEDAVIYKNMAFDPWNGVLAHDVADGTITAFGRITSGSVNSALAGQYTLTYKVSDSTGNQTEAVRKVQVLNEPIVFVEQPKSATANPGSSVSFTVQATSAGALSYQWRKNGVAILGGTQISYSVARVSETDEGAYDVLVSSSLGSGASSVATLSVNDPIQLTKQPVALTVTAGTAATFTVTASGTTPLTYQWRKNGINIAGGTGVTYGISAVQTVDAGSYSVVVSNVVGSVTSVVANLTINKASQSISNFGAIPIKTYGDAPFTVSIPTATSGLSVVLSVKSGPATVSGNTVTLTGAGSVVLSANQSGNANCNSAAEVTTSFAVTQALPTIISTPTASAITSGQALSSSVLSGGSASVAGTFTFTTPLTVPNVGTTSQSVTFTPSDLVNYSTAATSVSVMVNSLVSPPGITSGTSASGTVGAVFNYQIAGTNNPTSYSVTGLPSGLTVNASTGLISGTPTTAGQTTVTLRATNSAGTGTSTLALNVTQPVVQGVPVITSVTSAGGIVGGPFSYQITATNNPTSFSATGLPAGLSVSSSTGVISGSLNAIGQFPITLTATNSTGVGSATLALTVAGGIPSWSDFAGTYEGLLEQSRDSPVDDGAVYRGSFSMTFSRTGTVSGRVFYNEATALEGSRNRVYIPVTRTFIGMLTSTSANPLAYKKTIRLGTGASIGRQELTLDVSFESVPPRLNVTVKDTVSPRAGEDAWVSQALSCSRSITKLTTSGGGALDYLKAVGRYTLAATDSNPAGVTNAYVLAQLLPTGKLLWTSRMTGTLGTGSTGLRVAADGLSAFFYQGRASSTSTSLKSISLLGSLNFVWDSTSGSWSGNFGSDTLPGKLEKQASYISKTGGKLAFNDAQDSTGVTELDFSNKDGVRWGNATVTTVPTFLSGGTSTSFPFTLNVQDPPDADGNTVAYSWNVSVTASGRVLTTSTTDGTGVSSPRLMLTLNKQNGEFTGYYMTNISGKNVRRNIYGCGLMSQTDDALRARGWVESGVLPTLSTGGWTLRLGQ